MAMTVRARLTDVLAQRSVERLDLTDLSESQNASVGREYADTNERLASREVKLVLDEAPAVKVALDETGQLVADSTALANLYAALDDWIQSERAKKMELEAKIAGSKQRKR